MGDDSSSAVDQLLQMSGDAEESKNHNSRNNETRNLSSSAEDSSAANIV